MAKGLQLRRVARDSRLHRLHRLHRLQSRQKESFIDIEIVKAYTASRGSSRDNLLSEMNIQRNIKRL